MSYTVFAEGDSHLGVECPGCKRVLKVPRPEVARTAGGWAALRPILCGCGHSSTQISGGAAAVPPPLPAAGRARKGVAAQASAGAAKVLAGVGGFFGVLITLGLLGWYLPASCTQKSRPAPPTLTAAEQIYGPKPRTGSNSGRVYAVDAWLQANLKDPDSLDYIRWWGPSEYTWGNDQKGWVVQVQYRARNSFGGMAVERMKFVLQGEQVVEAVRLD